MNSDLKIEGLKRFIDQREHLAFSGRLKDLGDRIQRHELIFSGKGTITTFLYADRDQQNRPVLHLKMTGDIQLICQKCLGPWILNWTKKQICYCFLQKPL